MATLDRTSFPTHQVGGGIGKAPNLSEPHVPFPENKDDHNLLSIRGRTLNEVTHGA